MYACIRMYILYCAVIDGENAAGMALFDVRRAVWSIVWHIMHVLLCIV